MYSQFILGAGVTGLAAGYVSGLSIYEAAEYPGGICASYYVCPGNNQRLQEASLDQEVYRFEIGGGHWIFGGDPLVLRFIRSLTPVKSYIRRSAVYFPEQELLVPYPLQNHLRYLGQKVAAQALQEIFDAQQTRKEVVTMADWLRANFGPTLCELFFEPFHELYTAGLFREIAPQDAYKTPVDLSLVIQGAFDDVPPVGYNATFVYPEGGLNVLAQQMAERCRIQYGKRVVKIDVRNHELFFEEGTGTRYETLISTLPLNQVLEMTGLEVGEPADPYTSVLVLNIGAKRGPKCPSEHWVYVPRSKAGFHRVGFYSNVDVSFLPRKARERNDRVSIYVERAYPGGQRPNDTELDEYRQTAIADLQNCGWIGEVEVADATWIEVAYTWSRPGSRWRQKALKVLEEHDIYPVGRYARWVFQGIADSVREGLLAGSAINP